MDATVAQALAKWPNVPHCYGWLALDARGQWHMRKGSAQEPKLPGEKIIHPALIGFINRNYTHDAQGRWYFQNGPQRVYVDLEAAPYIAHTGPDGDFILHTGERLHTVAAWLSAHGRLFLQGDDKFALLDDRDLAQCLPQLQLDRHAIGDEQLLAWMGDSAPAGRLTLKWQGAEIPVKPVADDTLGERFGFVRMPRRD